MIDIMDMENLSESDTENLKYKPGKSSSSTNNNNKQLDSHKDSTKSLQTSNKLNKLETTESAGGDAGEDSPSIIKTKKCTDMEPPVSSQIQMTIWKEDSASQVQVKFIFWSTF